MTRLLAIDPGPVESAWVLYDVDNKTVVDWYKTKNDRVRTFVWRYEGDFKPSFLAIEEIKSYGNVIGDSTIQTCVWIGRFLEMWDWNLYRDEEAFLIPRKEVVTHICNNPKAGDKNVRQALIDRWGGKQEAIGLKATPGPLYGLKEDGWSALAVAVTCAETRIVELETKEQHV